MQELSHFIVHKGSIYCSLLIDDISHTYRVRFKQLVGAQVHGIVILSLNTSNTLDKSGNTQTVKMYKVAKDKCC